MTATAEPRIAELHRLAAKAGFNPAQYVAKWELQLGSLGSGNHFIEVCADETDAVWLFLHSGSRGVGNKIAQHHIKVAQESHGQAVDHPAGPGPRLPGGGHAGVHPVHQGAALGTALRPAEPRGDDGPGDPAVRPTGSAVPSRRRERINCHHNFTQQETHYGKSVWVSRKGAIRAGDRRPRADPRRPWGRRPTWSRGSATPPSLNSVAARCRPGVLAYGGAEDVHARPAEGRPCRASSSGPPRPSSMRSRRPTSPSTR